MKSQKLALSLGCLIIFALLSSCVGPQKEVPPAYVGKISGPNGLEDALLTPSKFRLDYCFFWQACDNLILVEASDQSVTETMNLYMPKDDLNLAFDVRGTLTVSDDQNNVKQIFNRITANKTDGRTSIIPFDKVYNVYGQPIIRETVRSTLVKYSIREVMERRGEISLELKEAVSNKLASTPIKILEFGLADVRPPEIIVKAQEVAKQREIAIKQAENDKLVALTQAEAAKEVALKKQEVDLIEAETQVLVEKKLNESVSEAFIIQRSLNSLQALVENENKTIVLLPMEALSNPQMLTGLLNQTTLIETNSNNGQADANTQKPE